MEVRDYRRLLARTGASVAATAGARPGHVGGAQALDLAPRIATTLTLAPLAIAAILLVPLPMLALLGGVAVAVLLWEWLALAGLPSPWPRGALVAAGAAGCWLAWHSLPGWTSPLAWAGVACWLLAPAWLRWTHVGERSSARAVAGKSAAGLVVGAAMFAAAADIASRPQGRAQLLFVITLVCVLDSLCYLVGRFVLPGRGWPLLAPKVSPNKNVGVLAIALVATLALATIVVMAGGRASTVLPAVAAALVAGVIGDLVASLMKRHAGVKDSGALLPGHGGVMDRLDSLMAALPVFVAARQLLGP